MRRLHPRSAAVSVGRAALQGAFFGLIAGTTLAGALGVPAWLVPLLAPLGAVLLGGFAVARYYRFRYEIDGETLAVESGVFARQSREIPLGRIQNVDVTQGVLNRLLGLSVVAFETAGGSATEATLNAVAPEEAERLRRLIHRHGERGSDAEETVPETDDESALGERVDGPETDTEDVDPLFAFGLRDLLTYALVSVRPAAFVFLVAGLPLGFDLFRTVLRFNLGVVGSNAALTPALLDALGPPRLVALALVTLVQLLVAALVLSVALTVVEYYGFTLVRDGEDLRYQRGLLRRYSGTIPLSKVQTVTVRENVLMRRFGFATLVVETAGYSGGGQQSTQGVAVPMASREAVYDLAQDIEPFGEFEFERPPTRARRRYAARFAIPVTVAVALAYAVDTLLLGTGYWWVSLALFALVPPAAHLRWRHRGYALDTDVFATRTGFWRQSTRVVPYYRVQTVFVGRSPFQRRRRLATVTADTASTSSILGGSATAYDIDDATAGELRDDLRERLYRDLLARRGSDAADQ
jgi:putative membrane protein